MGTSRTLSLLTVLICFAALALGSAACSSTPKKKERKRTVLMTEYDDLRVGQGAAEEVASEVGLVEDPVLSKYVSDIGGKLLRGVPRRGFSYQFKVVDMVEPNAFALPGGYVYVSRGLLALTNNEDELACVIGHEITHASHRHAAAQQALGKRGNPLANPWARYARMAAYSREMERDADEGGQILCAAAGYDPMGMSTFLKNLGQSERLTRGYARAPSFFDTHPGAAERAGANAVRASEIRWLRDSAVGNPRAALLRHIEGIAVAQRPESGVFDGDRFIHPDLGFEMRFPSGWALANTNSAVGATAPQGDAVVFLAGDVAPGALEAAANTWIEKQRESGRVDVTESKPVKVGHIDAWRMQINAGFFGRSVTGYLTFLPFAEKNWRISGLSQGVGANKYLGRTLSTTRSFRPISDAERRSVRVPRLRVVEARKGEGFEALGSRADNTWTPAETAVYNGLFVDHRFEGGETVKIARSELYVPKPLDGAD